MKIDMKNKRLFNNYISKKTICLAPFVFLLACAMSACGGGGSNTPPTTPVVTVPVQLDIVAAIRATADVISLEEKTSTVPNTRFFIMTFKQPIDHKNPQGATFKQTATLLLRDRTAPMVLAATGYGVDTAASEEEPTRLLKANQLTMEHRYFETSTPQPTDWKFLDIWQAASDEHRLVEAFKPLFTGKWINTGVSKGGMTSIFHRKFFPNDVSATVAYVAPIMVAASDNRYITFMQSRGTPENRAAIEAWQQAMLDHREEMKVLLTAQADIKKLTFDHLGLDKTFEFAVIEAPFLIWQLNDEKLAAKVPKAGATVQELFQYLDAATDGIVAETWSDSLLTYAQAYYYQCATQIGYPAFPESHLVGLKYPGQDIGNAYPPYGVGSKTYDPLPMRDIRDWVAQSASQMMFIYGENDPITAAAITLSNEAKSRDNWRYDVPSGNHHSTLAQLPVTQRNEAYAKLGAWAGVKIATSSAPPQPIVLGKINRARSSH